MKSAIFGLDIGASTLKVCWLDIDKKNVKYISSRTAQSFPKGLVSESPFDHQELAAAINRLVIDAKISTNNVSIALPENKVFTKVIDMPNLSEKELSSAIYWEAEQYIPAPLETMTLDWSILRKPSNNDLSRKMQVLLVASQKSVIKHYQMILELAGLSVVSIETEVISIIRSIVTHSQFPTSLIVNIGAMNTSLSIVQNGFIIFTYLIPLGGTAISRAIAADFGLNIQEADEYKKTYGLSDNNVGGKISEAIKPILSSITGEIRKALTFYSDKYKNDSQITQLLLTGGGSLLPGISGYLAQNTGLETIIANPWKMHSVAGVPEEIDKLGPEMAVCIGLAMKEYEY